MTPTLIAVAVLLALWLISVYNFFVSSKARIKASIQEIGNQLKRQADLIPNLESSVKGYLKHEKGIFEQLTDARRAVSQAAKSGNLQKMADASSKISQLLPTLSIAVEDNPELKGSEVVGRLMDELRDTADKVMYARRLVIDLTADFNVRRVTFPSSLVAGVFNFKELPGLITPETGEHMGVSKDETKTPKVSL
ncbi:LemA family protein [Candidatus Woesebacteria bacterium]|nr:LemA family protein [Candidatus Woesebacteria bacterium]